MHSHTQYIHPIVRDLAWILTSPPLMADNLDHYSAFNFDRSALENCWDWLTYLEKNPQKITLNKSLFKKLGHYFESLLAFLFSQGWQDKVISTRLLARNIKIIKDGKTLGELDLLLCNQHGQIIHVECAVKFYLGKTGYSQWFDWIGPNGIDRLDLKLERLLQHQLSVKDKIDRSALENICAQNNIGLSQIRSAYFLRGIFFYSHNRSKHLPALANPDALTAPWMTKSDFIKYRFKHPQHWIAVPKLNWLSGECPVNLADTNNTQLYFPSLMSDLSNQRERIMVVPDHWLLANSPSLKI